MHWMLLHWGYSATQSAPSAGRPLQGLEANPKVGRHMLLANRSAARLGAGELEGALADAKAAIEWAPPEYTTAFVRQVRWEAGAGNWQAGKFLSLNAVLLI